MMEWQAHIADDFALGAHRLILYRRAGDETEVITGFSESGTAIVTRHPQGATIDFSGLALPEDALGAIAEAVKPGPAQGEVARLEDALAVERRRVDELLGRIASVRPA